ncbi:hypothetical protein [Streptomyces sp. NPDC020742]|uniref:hypothetical protein n=1 Tax=Streptomyces sp. NPDC020742 TaxID=3154897 RepID=UPI0033DF6783
MQHAQPHGPYVPAQLAGVELAVEALQGDQVRGVGTGLSREAVGGQDSVLALGQDLAVVASLRSGGDVADVGEVVQFLLTRHQRGEQCGRDVDALAAAGRDARGDAGVAEVGSEDAVAGAAQLGDGAGGGLAQALGGVGQFTRAEHHERKPRCLLGHCAGLQQSLPGQDGAVQDDVRQGAAEVAGGALCRVVGVHGRGVQDEPDRADLELLCGGRDGRIHVDPVAVLGQVVLRRERVDAGGGKRATVVVEGDAEVFGAAQRRFTSRLWWSWARW